MRLSFSSWWSWMCIHDWRFVLIFDSFHIHITPKAVIYISWPLDASSTGLASPVAVQIATMSSQWMWMKNRDLQESSRPSGWEWPGGIPGGIRWVFEVTQSKGFGNWNGGVLVFVFWPPSFQNLKPDIYCMQVSSCVHTFILKLVTHGHVSVCNAKAVCSFGSIQWFWAGWKELLHRRVDSRTATTCKLFMFCYDFMSCYDSNTALYVERSGKVLLDSSQLIDLVS